MSKNIYRGRRHGGARRADVVACGGDVRNDLPAAKRLIGGSMAHDNAFIDALKMLLSAAKHQTGIKQLNTGMASMLADCAGTSMFPISAGRLRRTPLAQSSNRQASHWRHYAGARAKMAR